MRAPADLRRRRTERGGRRGDRGTGRKGPYRHPAAPDDTSPGGGGMGRTAGRRVDDIGPRGGGDTSWQREQPATRMSWRTSVATLTTSSWRRRSLRTCVCCVGVAIRFPCESRGRGMRGRGSPRQCAHWLAMTGFGEIGAGPTAGRRGRRPLQARSGAPGDRRGSDSGRGPGLRSIPNSELRIPNCPAPTGTIGGRGAGRRVRSSPMLRGQYSTGKPNLSSGKTERKQIRRFA